MPIAICVIVTLSTRCAVPKTIFKYSVYTCSNENKMLQNLYNFTVYMLT